MNLVVPAEIIAVAFVIVHAGSGKSRCFSVLPFVYLFSILLHESINVKVNSYLNIAECAHSTYTKTMRKGADPPPRHQIL